MIYIISYLELRLNKGDGVHFVKPDRMIIRDLILFS
jgi:hypothetical protein